jgi:hypothetical protein
MATLSNMFNMAKQQTTPQASNIPAGWSAMQPGNTQYQDFLGYGLKRTEENPGSQFNGTTGMFGDIEANKAFNTNQMDAYNKQYGPGYQQLQRKVGDGKYEYGMLNPDGSISNNWEKQYSTDNWMDKVIPALTMGTLGTMFAGGLGLGPMSGGAVSGAAPAVGNGAFLGEGAASGVGGWDAAAGLGGMGGSGIPAFSQLPGYGTEVANLAAAGGGSPFTGAAGADAVLGGSGLATSAPGAATGAGLNLGASQLGSLLGTGSGLGIAGAGATGAGLGAGIGASIPTGSALAGSALGGAAAGAGSGLASQFLGNASGGSGLLGNIAKQAGGGLVSNLLGQVLGGGGVSTAGNLGSLFTNYNQYKQMGDLIDEIKGIYSPEGAYAKKMESDLARQDAAAGRNSQYGPRLERLMGSLGDSQARALSGLGGLMNTQQGGLNGIVGAGTRLFDSMGGMNALSNLFSGSSGSSVTDSLQPDNWWLPSGP